jgi:hypothetical protein
MLPTQPFRFRVKNGFTATGGNRLWFLNAELM